MSVPNSRDSFKVYCLRKLGAPVIEINVDDDQLDDRVDEAIAFYTDYHFDGTEKVYYKYAVTQTDIDNQYFTLPANIIGAVNIFPIGMSSGTNGIFNIRYQLVANDLQMMQNVDLVPYYMVMQDIQMIEQLLVGQQPFRYNRISNRFYIDTDWTVLDIGMFIIVEAYQVIDPVAFPKMWSERWLQNYCTALIKEQWGANLTKYNDLSLPGGSKFNGEKILNDAVAEKKFLEQDIINNTMPAVDMLG